MEVGDIIAQKLEEKGWSQNRLAQQSGIAQPQINRVIRGERTNVTLATLRALAGALGCKVVDLLPEQDKRAA